MNAHLLKRIEPMTRNGHWKKSGELFDYVEKV